ncbi:MAG: PHP domain-containing protein [Gemmatimonadetes bacterium]|jgi:histidinol phosphatase-like PHP family hydrolase|nr:PHP domain-containing protein [Gemmatimonadota bacterium]
MVEKSMESKERSVPLMSTHTHTDLSLCGRADATFAGVVETAEELGFHTVVLTDHVHAPGVTDYPHHLNRLREYQRWRDELETKVEIVVGVEFEVAEPGRIIAPTAFVEICECAIVAPNHYHLGWIVMPGGSPAEVAGHELDQIETILDWPYAEVVAHPFAGTGLEHSPNELYEACDKERLRDLFACAKEREIGFEIQPKFCYNPLRAGRLAEFFQIWLEVGGKVALGSDAHALGSLTQWAEQYEGIVERFELSSDDLWQLQKREE